MNQTQIIRHAIAFVDTMGNIRTTPKTYPTFDEAYAVARTMTNPVHIIQFAFPKWLYDAKDEE